MNAIRQVYDELPASISMPKSLQTHHVEVIILSLEDMNGPTGENEVRSNSSLARYAGAWGGAPLVREAQGDYETREEFT
jgi:hypothetical protein